MIFHVNISILSHIVVWCDLYIMFKIIIWRQKCFRFRKGSQELLSSLEKFDSDFITWKKNTKGVKQGTGKAIFTFSIMETASEITCCCRTQWANRWIFSQLFLVVMSILKSTLIFHYEIAPQTRPNLIELLACLLTQASNDFVYMNYRLVQTFPICLLPWVKIKHNFSHV